MPSKNRPVGRQEQKSHNKGTSQLISKEDVPDNFNERLLQGALSIQAARWTSPYPPPEVLAEYDRVNPQLLARILDSYDNERAHRHEIERKVIDKSFTNDRMRMFSALFAVAMVLGVCAYIAYLGYPKYAAGLGAAVIIGVAAVFIKRGETVPKSRKNTQNQDTKKK